LLLDRVGRRQSAFGALLLVSAVAIGIGAAPGVTILLMLGLLWGMAWGFQETVFLSLALDLADTRVAASMFAITMAVSNVGTAIGEGVGTALTDDIGFRAVFWGLASLNVVAFLILLGLFRVAPDIVRPRQCGARTDAR
jgi:MFS family permease